MASNSFTRTTISGQTQHTRKGTQGRKKIPPELRKKKFSVRITPQTEAKVLQEAKKYNMTKSAYCDLALSLFDITVFVGQELVKQ